MTTQEELSVRLKSLGIRVTPQRLAITEVVLNSGDHPSAKEIFERVKAFFPYVTLATVYSTLYVLAQQGVVSALAFQRLCRYDPNLSPHANLVCLVCGTVVDADAGHNLVDELKSMIDQTGFEVSSQRVDFYGRCSACAFAPDLEDC